MIYDKLENFSKYLTINKYFPKIKQFLEDHNYDLSKLSVGIHEIDGKDLYLNVLDSVVYQKTEARYELHKHYGDVHIVFEPGEIYFSQHAEDAKDMQVEIPYNEQKDVTFYVSDTTNDKVSNNRLVPSKNSFVVFLPGDLHAPRVSENPSNNIIKYIFKFRCS
ncbi:YhcH/YjgK/YiaL family protein [Mycoplasma sp. T363T]|uniref:YhcH/YjgK/YiaL family protein n=1 Tax=Mycoplasma bradburyae TaxID=2963128 RepID=A0AAW6HQH5_9MOLU|nr:YhcH/YjgK/YiaL family protein [Mycoplasma bradburyae]MDC4163104.1 YhcH/YjgK/YiaL family protein [Mycoplasma bradburyae]MDC4181713.1 YhcH/YjgK/YiaL family protein [Mycoplasma bradburyae]MDC4182420.1 YhcH/YjgK/YiaL family protein [Mycoplasma bradburyae]MDC4183639.1 YhcH/YjgK/YiaL family protein [Mycoplasma bradburyae]UTS70241.1 YhcH/YjgK/YiaL family protein [Mycoplasma bradburyae]